MKRRTLLGLVGGTLSVGLSGCTSTTSEIGNVVEGRIDPSQNDDIDVRVSALGPTLALTPNDGVVHEINIYQDDDLITSLEVGSVNHYIQVDLVDCEGIQTGNDPEFEPGPITIVLEDADGEELGSKEWEFHPQPAVTGFDMATVTEYDPDGYPDETTPVFEIVNTGEGPACISEIEITNPRETVVIGNSPEQTETSFLREGRYSVDDPSLNIYEPAHPDDSLIVHGEETLRIALDGLFTHTSSNGDWADPPAETKELQQSFDVIVHTGHGRSFTSTLSVIMFDRIVEASEPDSKWTHRFQTVRLEDIEEDPTNPTI